MSILVGLTPFIAFFGLMRLISPLAGLMGQVNSGRRTVLTGRDQ